MEETPIQQHWQLRESQVIKPSRRYKAMRNNSMPDLADLRHPTHAEGQFIYNKWFIPPQQRLKRKPQPIRASLTLEPQPFIYETLYTFDQSSARPLKEIQEKEAAIRRICADGQNLKLLATFRNKKQQNSKRVPGVIDYIIGFHRREQLQTRQRLSKKTRFWA